MGLLGTSPKLLYQNVFLGFLGWIPKSLFSVALAGLYRKSSVRFEASVSSTRYRGKFYLRPIALIRMKQLLQDNEEMAPET